MIARLLCIALLASIVGCTKTPDPVTTTEQSAASDAIQGRGSNTQKWWDALPREEWSAYERILPEHSWFEVYRVLPDIYAIYEPHQFEEVISFLVVGENKALLFDTGLGIAQLRPVVAQLTTLDVMVVNSHSHFDHVGSNYEFDSITAVDDPFTRGNLGGRTYEEVKAYVSGDWMARPIPKGIDVSNYVIQPYTLTGYVDDGSVIDVGGRKLEVIRTPGHTPDSLCLFDRANRLLFTGDTFYLAPLYAHLEEANFADYHASVNRLAELAPGIDLLLTAHNVPVADGDYLLRLKAAFDAVDAGTVSFEETDGAREYDFDEFSIIAPQR